MRAAAALALLLLATMSLPGLVAPGAAGPSPVIPCVDPRGCPDLVVDAARMRPFVTTETFGASSCAVREGMVGEGTRTLVRFTFTTPNLGPGDLVVGSPDLHREWFERGTCHGHFHLREYADYRLWTPDQHAAWENLRAQHPDALPQDLLAAHPDLAPVRGDKRGFCVVDIVLYAPAPPKYLLCDVQGISVGWADEYHHGLDGQWVDVTGVPPGEYILEAEVNAERFYEEADYANNRASVRVTL